jgi:hypothetical protein
MPVPLVVPRALAAVAEAPPAVGAFGDGAPLGAAAALLTGDATGPSRCSAPPAAAACAADGTGDGCDGGGEVAPLLLTTTPPPRLGPRPRVGAAAPRPRVGPGVGEMPADGAGDSDVALPVPSGDAMGIGDAALEGG